MNNHNPNKGRDSRPLYNKPALTPTIIENLPTRSFPEAPKLDLKPTLYEDPRPNFRYRSTGLDQSLGYTAPTRSQLQTLDSDTLVELLTAIHAILNERNEV